jgi:hypothetical protein
MTSLTNNVAIVIPYNQTYSGGLMVPYTTVGNSYVEIATFNVVGCARKGIRLAAATNDLTFLIEGAGDQTGATGWYSMGECTIVAGQSHVLVFDTAIIVMRVSVKPAVGGAHGTAAGAVFLTDFSATIRSTFEYESLTITNAATVGFTRATMDSALEVMLTVEDNPIRYRCDGVAPTTTEGHLLQSGDALKLTSVVDALNFKCIASGGNAKIRVSYSR